MESSMRPRSLRASPGNVFAVSMSNVIARILGKRLAQIGDCLCRIDRILRGGGKLLHAQHAGLRLTLSEGDEEGNATTVRFAHLVADATRGEIHKYADAGSTKRV